MCSSDLARELICGVTQCSLLSLTLSKIYMTPLADVIRAHNVDILTLSGFCHPGFRWRSRGPCGVLTSHFNMSELFTTSCSPSSTSHPSLGFLIIVLMQHGLFSSFCLQTVARSCPGGSTLFSILILGSYGISDPFISAFWIFSLLTSTCTLFLHFIFMFVPPGFSYPSLCKPPFSLPFIGGSLIPCTCFSPCTYSPPLGFRVAFP